MSGACEEDPSPGKQISRRFQELWGHETVSFFSTQRWGGGAGHSREVSWEAEGEVHPHPGVLKEMAMFGPSPMCPPGPLQAGVSGWDPRQPIEP